jgi:hypothetical protein
MGSLAYVVSKMLRHLFATTNVPVVGIGEIATQKCESETMTGELLAGHCATLLHLLLHLALEAAASRRRWLGIPGHDGRLSYARDLRYQPLRSAW